MRTKAMSRLEKIEERLNIIEAMLSAPVKNSNDIQSGIQDAVFNAFMKANPHSANCDKREDTKEHFL